MKLIKKDMRNIKYNKGGIIDGMENEPDVYIQLLGKIDFEKMVLMKSEKNKTVGNMLIEESNTMFTESNFINNIQFEYDNGFEQVTLHLGTYGHIHIPEKEFKKLLDGLNWLNNKMIKLNEYSTTKYSKDKQTCVYLKVNGNYWLPEKERIKSRKEEKVDTKKRVRRK